LLDKLPLLKRQRISWRMLGYDADDLCLQSQRLAGRRDAAEAGTEADGHENRVQICHGAKHLQAIRRHAAHEPGMKRRHGMQAFFGGQFA
jgi:hypothetical protein